LNSVKINPRAGAKGASKGASEGASKGASKGARKKRAAYHHGDLRQQLLNVTEQIILERGVDGFTLREAARRAGVSPAAPAHHFQDAKGLLTEVAILGFRDFGDALDAADETSTDPTQRLHAQALAYVHFALEHPARFQLMFQGDKLDTGNPEFVEVSRRAYSVLDRAIHAATGTPEGRELAPDAYGLLLAVWSAVHGFSHLVLEWAFRGPGNAPATKETALKTLLPLMLKYLPVKGI
jgi:AcrR family transcriptional regulator